MSLTIQTKNLVKIYGSRTVVNNVSFNVRQGEIVGLLGPNGAGKTTSFYQVVGLVKPDKGDVFLNDINITKLPMYKRAQMGIGYLPQEASVFRKLSVEDNIAAVLEMTKLSKANQKEKQESLLNEFRLQHVRKNNGDTLSGGERRRTEIARALAVDPKFILLDEPFAGVDPIAVEDIQEIIAKLKYKNIGILITDHNVNETLSICDRAYLLIDGSIFKHGTADELANDEQVRKLYLGKNFELKRKDYLHDDARNSNSNKIKNKEETSKNLSYSVTNCVENINNFFENLKGIELSNAKSFEDLNLRELFQNIDELKPFIKGYAKISNSSKIDAFCNQLPVLKLNDFIPSGIMGLIGSTSLFSSINNIRVTKKLREQLSITKSVLEKINLIIENPDFAKVFK